MHAGAGSDSRGCTQSRWKMHLFLRKLMQGKHTREMVQRKVKGGAYRQRSMHGRA